MVGCDSQKHARLPAQYGRCPCNQQTLVLAKVNHSGFDKTLPHVARWSLEGDMGGVLEGWLFPEEVKKERLSCISNKVSKKVSDGFKKKAQLDF